MSNVLIEKNKLDILATAISNKSGEPLKLTLDEMVEAVDGIETGSGGITPTGNIDITQAGVTDVTNYATATVPENAVIDNGINGSFTTVNGKREWHATAWFEYLQNGIVNGGINYASKNIRYNAVASGTTITPTTSAQTIGGANYMMESAVTVNAVPMATVQDDSADWTFETIGSARKCKIVSSLNFDAGYINSGWVDGNGRYIDAVPANWTVTPTESSQIIGGRSMMMEDAVTVNAIPSTYVGSGITRRSSTDLTASGATVTVPAGYYSAQASKSVASGTAGTPTASKGTVSNHSVSVTPSVTNTTGYISGGTKTGTAVTVSASELVSGTKTVTTTGTSDVTNYASVNVDISFSTIYSGTSDPSSSLGVNGDIYLKVVD